MTKFFEGDYFTDAGTKATFDTVGEVAQEKMAEFPDPSGEFKKWLEVHDGDGLPYG